MTSSAQLGLCFDQRLHGREILGQRAAEAERLLAVWRWKSALGPGFPVIISLFGGTGTGKSTLFNSLAGEPVSRVSWLRPCTSRPVFYVHNDAVEELAKCPLVADENPIGGGKIKVRVLEHHRQELADFILVDTPDIDSVELINREIADAFFTISDIVVFVTSLDKYGDNSGKMFRTWIREWGKRSYFVMNKAHFGEAFEDFRETLRQEGFDGDQLIRVEDTGTSPDMIPGISGRPEFEAVLDAAKEDVRSTEMRNLRVETIRHLDFLDQDVTTQMRRIAAVNDAIRQALDRVAGEMDEGLDAVLSPEVASRVQERLTTLLQKYDILFPVRMFVRTVARKSLEFVWGLVSPGGLAGGRVTGERSFLAQDLAATKAAANLAPLEHAVARLNQEIAEILKGDSDLEDLRTVAQRDVPRLTSEAVRAQFDEAFPGVERLLEEELRRFRESGLSPTHEARLYGAYFFWALLLVTAEVILLGGSSWLDAILGPVIAPFIPKWLLGMKVRDVLREIGARIDGEYRGILRNILEGQAISYINEFRSLLPDDEALARLSAQQEWLSHEVCT
ncbi:MAG: 50S ribosome-binding GTPase [Desulfomonile sp.]|nr:50S ribosome-binding GTPase [Desulfomonile sp.]